MKCFLHIIILSLFITNITAQDNLSTFSGVIYDAERDTQLYGHVFIKKLNIRKYTDEKGLFKIDSIPEGIYEIEIRSLGYLTIYDTLNLNIGNRKIHKKYFLYYIVTDYKVELTKEFNNYHKNLKESAGENAIVEFSIDDFEYHKGNIFFYPIFENNTDFPVYILEEKECIKPFRFEVYNSKNEKINRNAISLSCDTRMFYNPDTTDLIKIPPKSSYEYPKTKVWLYYFDNLPKDEYTIFISYEYYDPLSLRVYRTDNLEKYSSEIYAAQISLPGKFKSNNKLIFEN